MKEKRPILITPYVTTFFYSNNSRGINEQLNDVIIRMLRLKREIGREIYTYFNNILVSTEHGDSVEAISQRYSDDMYKDKKFVKFVKTSGVIEEIPKELLKEKEEKGDRIFTETSEGTLIDVRDCKTEDDIFDKYFDSVSFGSLGFYESIKNDEDKQFDDNLEFLKEREKKVRIIARLLSEGKELVDEDDMAKITFSAVSGEIVKIVEYKVDQYDGNRNIIQAGTTKVLTGKAAILDLLREENVEWFTATDDFHRNTDIELDLKTTETIFNYIVGINELIVNNALKLNDPDIYNAIYKVIDDFEESKDFPDIDEYIPNSSVKSKAQSQKDEFKKIAFGSKIKPFFSFLEALKAKTSIKGKGGRQ